MVVADSVDTAYACSNHLSSITLANDALENSTCTTIIWYKYKGTKVVCLLCKKNVRIPWLKRGRRVES